MSIKITKPGIAASLQGTVRTGYRRAGIGGGGGMDSFAMNTANYLVGNEASAAVIEINFPAPEIFFLENAFISITGAEFSPHVNGQPVKSWTLIFIKKNSILQFKKPVNGARAYIAVSGGWKAELWLNSYSTHIKANAGGYKGRNIQKDDAIDFEVTGKSFNETKIFPWSISPHELAVIYEPAKIIRCVKSIEWDWLDNGSKGVFEQETFTVSEQSDRMGYRLSGKTLSKQNDAELLSSATVMGTIQLLPGGDCILLMADHQTTGGYPRIASVIKADLPKAAQLKAGDSIHFKLISMQDAEKEFLNLQQLLKKIQTACEFNLKNMLE